MDADALHATARARAEELPASAMGFPFGPEHEVHKVVGKVFALFTELRGTPIVTLKADPRDSVLLRETFADITPATTCPSDTGSRCGPAGTSTRRWCGSS